MPPTPLILSPALPSELLTYIIQHSAHPTTLLICFSRADFLASLTADVQQASLATTPHPHPHQNNNASPASSLLAAPLCQVAIARHIRVLFIPTVSHLRAYLAVFTPADSKIPPPPADAVHANRSSSKQQQTPLLLVYGFLGLHRGTSEWSAQGIAATAAGVVDAARRCGGAGARAVVVDAPGPAGSGGGGAGRGGKEEEEEVGLVELLDEEVPLLSARGVRAGADLDDAAWTGRKVKLSRVLGRWFRYREGEWARDTEKTS